MQNAGGRRQETGGRRHRLPRRGSRAVEKARRRKGTLRVRRQCVHPPGVDTLQQAPAPRARSTPHAARRRASSHFRHVAMPRMPMGTPDQKSRHEVLFTRGSATEAKAPRVNTRSRRSLVGGRAELGRGERQVEQVSDQPQNVEDAQHPQRSHQLVGRGAPGDAPDQAAAIGTFDGTSTRGRRLAGERRERIRRGLVHGLAVGCSTTRHDGGGRGTDLGWEIERKMRGAGSLPIPH